jgi:hypothetical protein
MTTFEAEYSLPGPNASHGEQGACTIDLEGAGIVVTPRGSASIPVRFAEIVTWRPEDYVIVMALADGSTLRLAKLARRFDEFVSGFRETRRDHFRESLLLEEDGTSEAESGSYEWKAAGGGMLCSGTCSVHLQRTSLACFPDVELPFLLPYGSLTGVSRDDDQYRLVLSADAGGEMVLHHFGRRTDTLFAGVEELRSQLAKRQGEAIAALAPEIGAMVIRRAGQLLRDGVPAERGELEAAAPGVWEALWRSGFDEERRPYAEYLREKASTASVVIKETGKWGASEETPPALADRRMLFLFHIGTQIVVEVPSSEDTATYVFHACGDVPGFVRKLCRALASVQFRREPLYVPLSAMTTPPQDRYAEACRLLPELIAARKAFAGRAIHSSVESWQKELDGIVSRASSSSTIPN